MKSINQYITEKLKISKHNHNILNTLNKICNCKSKEEFDKLYKDIFKEGEKLSSDIRTLDIIYSDNKDKILSTFDKNDLILAKFKNDNYIFFLFRPFKGKSQLCLSCNYENNKMEFKIWDIYNRDKYGGYFNPNLECLEYYKCNNNLTIQFDDFINELFDNNLYNVELCPNLEKKLNISSDKDKIIKRLL
jgi:hypothetical protein